jgi:hypothetical protein
MGLTIDNLEELKAALVEAVKTYDAVPDKRNQYGQKYIIDFPLTRKNKTAIIHSVWIIRSSENFPRLVTCYVL